jgi:hypothetical protein
MSSQLQIDSARRNGSLSRGPKTAEGRAKSALNSTKHGLNSKKLFVLANESEEAFSEVLEAIKNQFTPGTVMENDICVEMAHARWRLRRLWIVETAIIDKTMDCQQDELNKTFKSFDEGTRLAAAFESLASPHGALSLVTRYESRLTRNFLKLAASLQEMQRARLKKSQNEPDSPSPSASGARPSEIETISQTNPATPSEHPAPGARPSEIETNPQTTPAAPSKHPASEPRPPATQTNAQTHPAPPPKPSTRND